MKKKPDCYTVVDYSQVLARSTRYDSFDEALKAYEAQGGKESTKLELKAWFENPDFFVAYHYRYQDGEWIGPI